ncbi:transcriptional regulator NrdR [Planctomycetota bacterium]
MKCPFCKQDKDKVVDSRKSPDELSIRRRRECLECGKRFTTYERVEKRQLRVVKKGGERVPFDRDRLLTGLLKACWKRPVSTEQLESVVNSIETRLAEDSDGDVTSRRIGELIMDELRRMDKVAYVRFASVYRDFKDAEEFMTELKRILETK